MKLGFAFLADAAIITPDGKLQVQGGDIDTVYSATFPAAQPTMSLVVKLRADPNDIGHAFVLRLEALAPHNVPWFPPFTAPFTAIPDPANEQRPVKVAFVLNLPLLVFPTAGTYSIRLAVKGEQPGDRFKQLAELPIYAVVRPGPGTIQADEQAASGEMIR